MIYPGFPYLIFLQNCARNCWYLLLSVACSFLSTLNSQFEGNDSDVVCSLSIQGKTTSDLNHNLTQLNNSCDVLSFQYFLHFKCRFSAAKPKERKALKKTQNNSHICTIQRDTHRPFVISTFLAAWCSVHLRNDCL